MDVTSKPNCTREINASRQNMSAGDTSNKSGQDKSEQGLPSHSSPHTICLWGRVQGKADAAEMEWVPRAGLHGVAELQYCCSAQKPPIQAPANCKPVCPLQPSSQTNI